MPKAKIEQDGQELEIEVSDEQIAEWGYVSKSQIESDYVPKGNVETIIKGAKAQQSQSLRKSLAEDPDFIREVAESRGWPVNDEGELVLPEGGLTAEEVQKQVAEKREAWQQQWEKKNLEPVAQKAAGLEKQIGGLRRQILVSEIIQAAKAAGVKDEKFDTLPGSPLESAPVVQQVLDRFKWSEEHQQWGYAEGTKPDGTPNFQISSTEDTSRPLAGASEFFAKLRENRELGPRWFNDTRPGTYGPSNTNGQATIGSRKRSQMSDLERVQFIKAHGQEAYLSLPN